MMWRFLLGLLFPLYAFGASFDCSKAQTSVERTICSDEAGSFYDDLLAYAYKMQLSAGP